MGRRRKKIARFWVILFITCLCMALELPLFAMQGFAAEILGDERGTEQVPQGVLADSLEPLVEVELKPGEIAACEAESKSHVKSYSVNGVADEWKKYASTYCYEHEDFTDAQRVFWDQLDAQCEECLTGTKDAALSGSAYYLPLLTYENLTYDQAKSVYQMFRYSNPQYYFLGNSLRYSKENCKFQISVLEDFAKGTDRAAATARVKYQIEQMVSEINKEETDLMKEKAAHDLICEKVVYDKNYNNASKNKFNQSIYSVLCTDSTVCAGYSQMMMLLMNAVGINCVTITSETHAWNMVQLDLKGEEHWYYTDLTWDDQDNGWVYTYFNRSRGEIHRLDSGSSHMEEDFWEEYLPALSKDTAPAINLQDGYITITSLGNDIYYTLDTGIPFQVENAIKYTKPIPVSGEMEIVAVTFLEGWFLSQQQRLCVYQVDFLLGGEVFETQMIPKEGKAAEPIVKEQPGYIFTGWYTNPEYTNAYSFESPVAKSMTLYGAWREKKTYQVTFDSCGGSSMKAQSIEEGSLAVPGKPKKKGYTFKGWYTSKDYKDEFDFSREVTSDIILYAKWKANTYQVIYKANGGYIGKKSVGSKKMTVTYDKKYGRQPEPKRKNYVFLGWYTKKSGGSKIEDSQIVSITGNKTYYAHWAKVKPKKAVIVSVKSKAAGKMTVNIKSVGTASGYEIRYSQKSSMASAKKVKTDSTTKIISGLKKGKKYYVQVRMYQRESVSGKIHHGAWSSKKNVVVKKK